MSEREIRRAGRARTSESRELSQKEAATMLRLSYRQVKRLYRRYEAEGSQGLVHRTAGRRSNHAKSEAFRRRVLKIVREQYGVRREIGWGRRWQPSI